MITAIITAAVVGFIQFYLDIKLLGAVFGSRAARGLFAGIIKLSLYGIAFILLFKLFRALVKGAAIGFAIGFFPCLFIYCIRKILKER